MFSSELHNRIVNDPSVKPFFGKTEGPVDVSPLLEDPMNYVLVADGEDAVAIFEWSAPNVWSSHYAMLPTCRGRKAVDAARSMSDYMFDHEGAFVLWGQTPVDNARARWLNRMIGAESRGLVERDADGLCELFWLERK